MSRSRVLGRVVLATALAVSALGTPASADDHEPPRTVLETGATSQRGRIGSSCWVSQTDQGYLKHCIDRIPQWPRIERARAGTAAAVVILKPTRPEDVVLESWRRIDQFGAPVGRPRPIPFGLRPATRAGEPVWEVRFRLPEAPGPVYLRLFALWFDEEVAPDELQDAEWRFRLRLA